MRPFLRSAATLLILSVISVCSMAQPVDTLWTRTYWNGWFDSLNWLEETSDRGFIMVGSNRAEDKLDGDVYLIKTDSLGEEEWSQIIGDEHYECGFHVLQADDGGYLISARSDITAAGSGGIWIIKTDEAGDTVWTYPWSPDDHMAEPRYACKTLEGGYAVTGVVNVSHDNQAFILKLNGDGSLEDWAVYGAYGFQDGYYITQMSDSGFIFTGHWDDVYGSGVDWWAVRTNKLLGVVWDSVYALTDSYDETHASCRVDDGIVMVGQIGNIGHVMKINFDGQPQWSKTMSIRPYDEIYNAICPTGDGGFMVGGWHWVTGARRNFTFIRLNSVGDTLWTYQVGGPQDDHGESLVRTYDGNYALAGSSTSWVNGQCMWLVKIGPQCCEGIVGDANGDGQEQPTLGDIGLLINALFIANDTGILPCLPEADVNQSGGPNPTGAAITIGDISILIDYLFITGPSLGLPECFY